MYRLGAEWFSSNGSIIIVNIVGAAFFPLDERLGLAAGSLSPDLAREVVWLSGQVPYEDVSDILSRIGGLCVPSSTVWDVVHRQGERLLEAATIREKQVSIERTQWKQPSYDPALRKGVSMDGGMVNIRGEGWKELKVGVVSTLSAPQDRPEALTDAPLGSELHYVAVVGDVEAFSRTLWALAVQCDVPYAGQVAVTADGAPWIWHLTNDLFPCAVQIVDWYHAAEHLEAAAQTHCATDETAHAFAQQLKTDLFQGECFKVIHALHNVHLHEAAVYFETHQYRMQYPAFRAEGFPIGSGSTESGVKQFKHRLCGPGMRWSRPGAQRMTLIRSALLDHSFDTLWNAA
jgi:hypothetical protein